MASNNPIDIDTLIGWDDLLTGEERAVRDAVRRFVRERCQPHITEDFEAGRFRKELVPELAELGLFGAPISGYGCAGVSAAAYGLACHELEHCDSGLRSFVSVQTSLTMYAIWRWGSEEQRKRWLPEMAAGRVMGCFGLTEPESGSDPGSMRTTAARDGDCWIISGEKMWITSAQTADIAVVWARTEEPGRIRGFILERGKGDFTPEDIPHKLSMRASHTGGLRMDEARVPDSQRLPEAMTLGAPLSCLNNARFGVAFGVLGAARDCLERAIAYTRERRQFDVPIASKQLVQARLADMAQEVVKASLLSLHYARLKDKGTLVPAQVSLLKRNNCRIALAAARDARALLGANGITADYHVLRHALNLESTYTYEGTDDIHTLVIGHALTGERAF
jgi:glutaryl-CoA dehydrogenase